MALNNILFAEELDMNLVRYGEVKKLENGGKMVYVYYNGQPLVLQPCECIAPFGLNVYAEEGRAESYSIDLSFRDMEKRTELKALYECFHNLDNKNIDEGTSQCMAWIRKKATRDVTEMFYSPIIKRAKDKETGEFTDKYAATFKIKIPCVNGRFTCDVYNTQREKIDIREVNMKGALITPIIQCTGIWLAGGKFGMTWKLVQMLVKPKASIQGFAIRESKTHQISESDVDADTAEPSDEACVVRKKPTLPPKATVENANEDEDDDEDDSDDDGDSTVDDEEEEEEEPTVIVPSKKSGGSRKSTK